MTKYPFKFLNAYNKNDRDIFFGRDTEIDTLYEMVFETDILFLYGASGTGKTSLLRCGLANRFKETHWSELFVLRGKNINDALLDAIRKQTPVPKKIVFDFEQFEEDEDGYDEEEETDDKIVPTPSTSQNEVVIALEKLYKNTFNPIYLIFDQFEELYTIGDIDEQEQFISTIKDILNANIPCRLLFSMREEYLAHLYEFEKEVPELLEKKMRIAQMDYQYAEKIILKATAIEQSNVHLTKGKEKKIAKAIIDKIREKRIKIELPIFQMMMDSLYEAATGEAINREKDAFIDLELIQKVGTIEDLLTNFLISRVNIIHQELLDRFPTIPKDFVWQILSPFATLEGTKAPLNSAELNQKLQNLPSEWIKQCRILLDTNRILRYREDGDLYELVHDVLAKEVRRQKSDEEIAIERAEQLLSSKFSFWSKKPSIETLLTEKDLAIIAPSLSRISLDTAKSKFIQSSRENAMAELVRLEEKLKTETALKETAEGNERKAKLFSRVAIGVMVVALVLAGLALFLFFEANEANVEAKKATTKAINSLAENIKNQKKAAAKELITYAQSYCDLDEKSLALTRLEAAKDTLVNYPDDPLYKELEGLIANPCQ